MVGIAFGIGVRAKIFGNPVASSPWIKPNSHNGKIPIIG
jgi:hypothetical protein